MFKVVAEVVALALFVLALVGAFSTPGALKSFLGVAVVAVLGYAAVHQTVPGHELVTLLGVALLLFADLVWFANTYAGAHNISLFGWIQGHKGDANLKAEVQAAGAVAVTSLKADAQVAKTVAVAAAGVAGGQVAGAALEAVKAGVEAAVEKKVG
jgi:energy-coupling factor transporter transmembrane protein EcfT